MACMSGYVPVRMGQVGALHDDLLGPGRDRLRTLQRRQLLLPLAPQPPEHNQGEILCRDDYTKHVILVSQIHIRLCG